MLDVIFFISINGYSNQSDRLQRCLEFPSRLSFGKTLTGQYTRNLVSKAIRMPSHIALDSCVACIQYSQDTHHFWGCLSRSERVFCWLEDGNNFWVVSEDPSFYGQRIQFFIESSPRPYWQFLRKKNYPREYQEQISTYLKT